MKNSPSGASAELPACALGVPIFRVLPDTGLLELGQLLHHRPVRRGEVIAQAGDPITDLIIVARGRLRAIQTSPSGREQTVRTLGPGDFVGELALFSPAHHASDLIAAGDGQVCLVPRAGIQSLMQRHPEVATALVAALAERLAAAAGGDKTTIALTERGPISPAASARRPKASDAGSSRWPPRGSLSSRTAAQSSSLTPLNLSDWPTSDRSPGQPS